MPVEFVTRAMIDKTALNDVGNIIKFQKPTRKVSIRIETSLSPAALTISLLGSIRNVAAASMVDIIPGGHAFTASELSAKFAEFEVECAIQYATLKISALTGDPGVVNGYIMPEFSGNFLE